MPKYAARLLVIAAVAALLLPQAALASVRDDLPWELQQELEKAMKDRIKEFGESKNEFGAKDKRARHSRRFVKVDDSTYRGTMLVQAAGATQLKTDNVQVTLEKEGKGWKVAGEQVVSTYDEMYRQLGGQCSPFETFDFEKYGMKMTARNGGVCEYWYEGEVESFIIMGDGMSYTYTPPTDYGYDKIYKTYMNEREYRAYMEINPKWFEFRCDAQSCEELLGELFAGMQRGEPVKPDRLDAAIRGGSGIPAELWDHVSKEDQKAIKDRKDKPFTGFRPPDDEGNRYFSARVYQNEDESTGIYYDNWGGFEVEFFIDVVHPTFGPTAAPITVFGYYTDETKATTSEYELEMRPDHKQPRALDLPPNFAFTDRWFDVEKVDGTVAAGLVDPEMLAAQLDFGIRAHQEIKELPFLIAGSGRAGIGGDPKSPPLYINSVTMDGQELTYVMTGSSSGFIVLPEAVPAGGRVDLSMDFETRAIYKVNPAFSAMARFGWMPFVDFGDFIHEFDMVTKVRDQYTTLGIGRKVSEKVEDGVRTTTWTSDSPVVFPTIIYGKYVSDDVGKCKECVARKLDGTPIPVEVHVDEVSMGQLSIAAGQGTTKAIDQIEALNTGARGIRAKQLRPIATQAAVSINMFNEISGVDYPYAHLNLVNDPAPALYGQAPSSLIYLGSFVFRGEGSIVSEGGFGFGGSGFSGTGTAKFLKSVVAHEVGHQWWGSRVANQNTRNYWFVETLAEYFSAIYLERVFGGKEYQEQVDEWRRAVLNRDARASVQHSNAIFPGPDFGGAYQANVYNKGPMAFHMARQIFGDELFFKALKAFSQKLTQKGEIVSRDIQMVLEEVLGGVDANGNAYKQDLEWFFDQWIRGVGIPEFRLTYDVRETEDGGAIIEGKVEQRMVVGSIHNRHVVENEYYRGIVPITIVLSKNREANQVIVVDGPEHSFRLKVPEKPLDVVLDRSRSMLAHDAVINKSW